jgi:hypothetical protein
MVNTLEAHEKPVHEKCENCGHPLLIHFDSDDCKSHWKKCPNCNETTKLHDYCRGELWKIQCSCGKIFMPRKEEKKKKFFSKTTPGRYLCPD